MFSIATTVTTQAPVIHPEQADGFFTLLWVIIALPALGAAVILVLGNDRTRAFAHWLGCATVLGSFVLSLVAFFNLQGLDEHERQVGQHLWTWFEVAGFKVGLRHPLRPPGRALPAADHRRRLADPHLLGRLHGAR